MTDLDTLKFDERGLIPAIVQDPEAFAAAVEAAGFRARVLAPGESLTL